MELPVKEEAARQRNIRIPYWILWTGIFGVLLLVCIGIYAALKPGPGERFKAHQWCVLEMKYDGKPVDFHTTQVLIHYENGCDDRIYFLDNYIYFPGVNSPETRGLFRIDGDVLEISKCYTLGDLYNGNYTIKTEGSDCLILESEHTWMKVQPAHGIFGY